MLRIEISLDYCGQGLNCLPHLSLRSSLFFLAGESESQGEVARKPGATAATNFCHLRPRALARLPLA